MEGWTLGKTKVFLRYYNDEFLARLYEVQVKKIIKVQSMMRALLARKRMKGGKSANSGATKGPGRHDEAASTIQKGKIPEKGYDVEYLDTSETPSEVEEMFEDSRKDEALAGARISEIENAAQGDE